MLDADDLPEGEAVFQVNSPISLSPEALAVYNVTEEINHRRADANESNWSITRIQAP